MITSIEEQKINGDNYLMQTFKSELTEKNRNKKIIENSFKELDQNVAKQ